MSGSSSFLRSQTRNIRLSMMETTILFGNGMNWFSKGFNQMTWPRMLSLISGREKQEIKKSDVPYTFQFEDILLSEKVNEQKIRESVERYMQALGSNPLYEKLLAINVENYLTTNYDHSVDKSMPGAFVYSVDDSDQAETSYSTHRHRTYKNEKGDVKRIWAIHGDMDYPRSMMLGEDQYNGSLSLLNTYLKDRKKACEDFMKQMERDDYRMRRWMDSFFFTDMHIIGFGLDFSEVDIWWMLVKRKKYLNDGILKKRNYIYFYTTDENQYKMDLLKYNHRKQQTQK